LNARAVALEAIRRVTDAGGFSNLAVPGALRRSGMSPRDRAFAADLAYGTLRNLPRLDHAIARTASRPIDRMTGRARAVLRLGAYQLLVADVPAHAAVSETVELASPRERGFANAILRKIAVDPPQPPQGEGDREISIRTGLTAWAVAELRALVGAEAEAAASALARKAPLTLRVNTCRISTLELRDLLTERGIGTQPSTVDEDALIVGTGGDPSTFPGFDEGCFAVQDAASAYVVRSMGLRTGDRVLDLCAAPGGKATHETCLAGDGAVVASDVHPRRAGLIARAGRRLGVRPLVIVQDGRRPAVRGGFDHILVDAPCSGLGSARRRPELLWRPKRSMQEGLADLQTSLLASAFELLRPGGRLTYSVCTFPRAETDDVCEAFLRSRPAARPLEIDGPEGRTERLRLWPHVQGCDAMFVAAFGSG
jgi:16S rRNA (cytosine967-C5)-methyltransferase